MTELLACPFCGGEAVIVSSRNEYAVQCSPIAACYGSSAEPGRYGFRYKEDAIRLWNKRPSLNAQSENDDA